MIIYILLLYLHPNIGGFIYSYYFPPSRLIFNHILIYSTRPRVSSPITSIQLFFGLPLSRFPSTIISIVFLTVVIVSSFNTSKPCQSIPYHFPDYNRYTKTSFSIFVPYSRPSRRSRLCDRHRLLFYLHIIK